MTKDSPLTVAGAAAELGDFPAPHSLLIPKTGTVGNHGRSLSKTESIRPWASGGPHWTSALFLPQEHACPAACTGAGKTALALLHHSLSIPRPEEPRSGVSKDVGHRRAAWFETRFALLTMRGLWRSEVGTIDEC